jgi:hypothetical protein
VLVGTGVGVLVGTGVGVLVGTGVGVGSNIGSTEGVLIVAGRATVGPSAVELQAAITQANATNTAMNGSRLCRQRFIPILPPSK